MWNHKVGTEMREDRILIVFRILARGGMKELRENGNKSAERQRGSLVTYCQVHIGWVKIHSGSWCCRALRMEEAEKVKPWKACQVREGETERSKEEFGLAVSCKSKSYWHKLVQWLQSSLGNKHNALSHGTALITCLLMRQSSAKPRTAHNPSKEVSE